MKKIPLIVFLALALIGCTKQGAVPEAQVSPGIQADNPGISRDIVNLTADDAVTVAQLFCSKDEKTKGGEFKTVKDVVTLSGKDGSANMYAVNFCNDEGFILVSATKKYAPILAFSEKGGFDDSVYETGMAVLLDEYEKNIDYCKTLPEESVEKYSKAWKDYEQKNCLKPELLTKSEDDLMAARAAAIAAWTNAGYECYALEQMENVVPSDVYNEWCQVAEYNSNQHYDYFTNAIVIVETEDFTVDEGPLLSTTWHQGDEYGLTYNQLVPHTGSQYPLAGCANVAMAQIMKYHEWPAYYSWDLMYDNYPSYEAAILLRDLGRDAGTEYHTGNHGSETETQNMYNAIVSSANIYNYSATLQDHNMSQVGQNIIAHKPVFMTGYYFNFSKLEYEGHSWVCDGYSRWCYRKTYTLQIVSIIEPPVQYESAGTPYIDSYDGGSYFHMNWGWGGSSDCWCYQDGTTPSGHSGLAYILFREDIINITPNR